MRRIEGLALVVFVCMASLAQPAQQLRIPLPLPRVPGGHIVYTKYVGASIPATSLSRATMMAVPKLFVMRADGSGQQPFIAPQGYVLAKDPRWSPTYDRLLFVSNYLPGMSCCVEDIFEVYAANGAIRRITGNELRGTPPAGVGSITGIISCTEPKGGRAPGQSVSPYSAQQIQIAAQGAGPMVYHPDPGTGRMQNNYAFAIPAVAAGRMWIKVWVDKYVGGVTVCNIKPGQVTNVGVIHLSKGNYLAAKPSMTRDGQWIVGMGGIASATDKKGGINHDISANVTVWRASDGQIAAAFEPMRAQGESAKDPMVSPVAPVILCAWGRLGGEHVAALPIQALLAHQQTPQVIVRGGHQLAQGPAGMPIPQTFGAGNTVWSPDGRMIAFCRSMMQGQYVRGEIFIAGANGGGMRQITRCGQNQMCAGPCFSPDGRSLAFVLVTAKQGMIDMLYFVDPGKYLTFNICRINLDGSAFRQLTNDGVSVDPAWGP